MLATQKPLRALKCEKKNITCESNQNPYAAAGSILSGWLDNNNHLVCTKKGITKIRKYL